MKCVKAHALGNDFLLIQCNDDLSNNFIKNICNRKFGIGADQVLCINSKNEVKIWNIDGSTAKMCANGLRSLAKWLGVEENIFILENTKVKSILYKNEVALFLPAAKIKKNIDHYIVDVLNLHKIYFIEENALIPEIIDDTYNISYIYIKNNQAYARTFERGAGETFACGSAAFAIASLLDSLNYQNLDVNFKYGIIKHKKINNEVVQIGPANIVAEVTFL